MYSIDRNLMDRVDKCIEESRRTSMKLQQWLESDEWKYIQKCRKLRLYLEPIIKDYEERERELVRELLIEREIK